jgi:hypothetical protein
MKETTMTRTFSTPMLRTGVLAKPKTAERKKRRLTARAAIPLAFLAQGHEFPAGDYVSEQ